MEWIQFLSNNRQKLKLWAKIVQTCVFRQEHRIKIVYDVPLALQFFINKYFPTMIYVAYSAFSCFIKICIFCLQNIMQIGFLVFFSSLGVKDYFWKMLHVYLLQTFISPEYFLCISNINCVLFFIICSIDVRFLIVYGLYVNL